MTTVQEGYPVVIEVHTADYPETADIETSSEDYARRFSGPAGEWMLKVQEKIVLNWVFRYKDCTVLDVGGGHGQISIPLSRNWIRSTVLGSSEACASRIKPEIESGKLIFRTGNIVALPFEDRSFDMVVCIRLLAHCTKWKQLVGEMCRVAQKSVIVDYPTLQSLNLFSEGLFEAKKKIEGNTRPFTLFRHGVVSGAFAEHGFRYGDRRPEFFIPMVVHRMLKAPKISAMLEAICRGIGLTRFFGSPVLARFDRQERVTE